MGDGYQEVQEVISIHAPTRGATLIFQMILSSTLFQSTLPREERLSFPCNISFHLIFQSTLPREERPQHYLIFKPYARISIHAPTRGATIVAIS